MSDLVLPRRKFLTGLISFAVAAPAIVKAASLMPVKAFTEETLALVDIGQMHVIEIWGVDAYGKAVREYLPLGDQAVVSQKSFQYVGYSSFHSNV